MTNPTESTTDGGGVSTAEPEAIEKTRHCPMYKVFGHNDDQTPMDLVVQLLTGIFGLERARAVEVMWEIHEKDIAFVSAFSLEQAEFRVEQAHSIARARKFPLKFTYEPE